MIPIEGTRLSISNDTITITPSVGPVITELYASPTLASNAYNGYVNFIFTRGGLLTVDTSNNKLTSVTVDNGVVTVNQ